MKPSELLDSKEKWCQRASSRDPNGNTINPTDDKACSWCLFGAIYKCVPSQEERYTIYNRLNNILPGGFVYWQDQEGRTFEEVRALLLEAGL